MTCTKIPDVWTEGNQIRHEFQPQFRPKSRLQRWDGSDMHENSRRLDRGESNTSRVPASVQAKEPSPEMGW